MLLLAVLAVGSADARNLYHDCHDYHDDRRDAHRTAVVVGAGTSAIVPSNRRHDRWD